MSDSGYLKCSCSYCQGHIEFPAHAAGITTTCPHCGVETTLIAPAGASAPSPPPPPPPKPTASPAVGTPVTASMTRVEAAPPGSKSKKVLSIVGSVLAGLLVLGVVGLKGWKYFRRAGDVVEAVQGDPKSAMPKPASDAPQPAPMPTSVAVPTSVVLAKGTPAARKPGDDLQLLSFEVQKAKDGNLQYIVGVVTNHAAKQYFNVKLTFDLTRQGGKTGDTATDTLRNLPANVGSTFKVNIIGTTPVTAATLAKLEGEKE